MNYYRLSLIFFAEVGLKRAKRAWTTTNGKLRLETVSKWCEMNARSAKYVSESFSRLKTVQRT